MSPDNPLDPDKVAEARQAFEALLDSFAVETEHRDVTRIEAFRELLVNLLDDDGSRFEWTREEVYREWMRGVIESIDRKQAGEGERGP